MTLWHYLYKVQIIIGCCCLCINTTKNNDSCHCGSKLSRRAIFSTRKEDYCIVNGSKINASVVRNERKIEKMVKIDAGVYFVGTNNPIFVADGEGPKRQVALDSFYIDKFEVSNEEFATFVNVTGYTTEAESFGNSFVFESFLTQSTKDKIKQVVMLTPWWLPVKEASWQHPEGPDSNITCK